MAMVLASALYGALGSGPLPLPGQLFPPPPLPPLARTASKFNLWFVGILIYLAGTIFQALGANMQRYSAVQNATEEKQMAEAKPPIESKQRSRNIMSNVFLRCCKRPLTMVGVFLFAR